MGHLKLDSRNRRRVKYCPCGKKNQDGKFVPFIQHEKFGYCHSCGKTRYPQEGTIVHHDKIHIEEPTFYYPLELVEDSLCESENSNLIKYLYSRFNNKDVNEVLGDYFIGTSSVWRGSTVFWQIDAQEEVRHGKIMLYNSTTGRRSKNLFNTMQKALKIDARGFKIRQCLFGLHLIAESNKKKVAIVESEKTAIVMTILFPGFLWMATGGKAFFKYDMLEPIKSHKIIAFPDKDAIEEWSVTAKKLKKYGFNIQVNTILKDLDVDENTDSADVFLDMI